MTLTEARKTLIPPFVFGDPIQIRAVDRSSLAAGEAWVWSPHFLKVCERVQIRRRRTFDSGATPKHSAKPRASAVMADIDLAAIAAQMKDTIERAEQADPKALRRRIAELERQVKEAPKNGIDKNAIKEAYENGRRSAELKFEGRLAVIGNLVSNLAGTIGTTLDVILDTAKLKGELMDGGAEPFVGDPSRFAQLVPPGVKSGLDAFPTKPALLTGQRDTTSSVRRLPSKDGRPRPQQAILDGLAWLEAIGLDRGKRTICAFLAGASPSSSAYMNNLGGLRSAGLIDYPESGAVSLTAAGRGQASPVDAPGTPAALHEMIFSRLPGPQARILQTVIRVYPQSLKREAVADLAGASATSSAFMNNLGALRSLGLIDYPRQGEVAALPILLLERGAGGAS